MKDPCKSVQESLCSEVGRAVSNGRFHVEEVFTKIIFEERAKIPYRR